VFFICQRFAPEPKRGGLGFRYRVFQNLCFSDTSKYGIILFISRSASDNESGFTKFLQNSLPMPNHALSI